MRPGVAVGVVASVATTALMVGGGASAAWLPPHDLSPVGNSYGPQLLAGADGVTHAWWFRANGGVETSDHRPGQGWTPTHRLSAEGALPGNVRPSVNAVGDLAAVWVDSNGGQLAVQSASRPRGGEWSDPAAIVTTGAGQLSDAVSALAPDRTTVAVWNEPDPGTSLSSVRASVKSAGGSWSAPTTISTPTFMSLAPKLVVDRDGTATALWYSATAGGINRVFAASRPAGGTWSAPELLSIHDWAGGPFVTVAADGTVLAAWRAREPVLLRYTMEVAVRSPGGSWTVRSDIDGGTAFGHNVDVPAMAVRPDGEMTVAWSRQMGDWYRVQTVTRPAGSETWSAPVTISADGRNAFEPKVAYGPDGAPHIAWRRRNDVNYIVQHTTRGTDGAWSTPDNLSEPSTANLELADISLVFDVDGDPVVSWYRHDGNAGRRVQITANDTHGPRLLQVAVPEAADPGESLAFSVADPVDTWSDVVGETTWSFGDGTTATGNAVQHAFAAGGSYDVTVAATDALGNRSEQTRTVTVTRPPVVDPPVVDPPVVDPPVVIPPVVDPPVTAPPWTAPPRTTPRAAVVCRVPRITGLKLATAKRRLKAADCRLGKVRYVTGRRNVGKVTRASRKAGTKLKKGTKIDVTVVRRPRR